MIDQECMQCLFPSSITRLGARESMSSRGLLKIFQPDEENAVVYIILSKIITEVFDGIAYNGKFTTHLQDSDTNTSEIMKSSKAIVEFFDILRQKFNPFETIKLLFQ